MHKQLTIRYMTFWEKSTTRFSNDNKKCKQIASPQMTQIAAYIFWSLPNGMARTVHDPKWSRPQMIPQFFSQCTRLKWPARNYWNGMGWRLVPEDARITRIKYNINCWVPGHDTSKSVAIPKELWGDSLYSFLFLVYIVTSHGFNVLIQYSVDNQTKKQTILTIILKNTVFLT